MTELKGIKIEDLNVTKSTFIKLIGLLNLNLELPDDELIEFYSEPPKTLDDRFYHLSFWLDSGYYIFTLEIAEAEPEQPVEDAEEPAEVLHVKDCGLTESEENFLELLLIEEISRLSVLSSQSSDDNTIELISEQLDTLVNIKDKLFVV